MKMHIEIDIENDEMTISEEGSTGEIYTLDDQEWPYVIDDICNCLQDYLEGFDHELY